LFINLGELDSLDRTTMKEYISEISGVPLDSIVSVEVKSSFSFIEIKSEETDSITNAFKNVRYNNRNVRIESRGDSGGDKRDGKRSYGGGSYGKSYGNSRGGGSRNGGFGKSYGNNDRSYGNNGYGKSYSDRERIGIAARGSSPDQGGERKNNFTREKRPRKQF
jgi:hypothetical protein